MFCYLDLTFTRQSVHYQFMCRGICFYGLVQDKGNMDGTGLFLSRLSGDGARGVNPNINSPRVLRACINNV